MSKEAIDWARRQQIADGSMKPLLMQLAYMHKTGRNIFPSQKALADATGKSPRTVWEALRLLEIFGLIKRKARSNGAHGRTSDIFELSLLADFPCAKKDIAAVRRGLRNSHNARSAKKTSQLAHSASPPRTGSEGIGDEQKYPSQEQYSKSAEGEGHPPATGLRLIPGGRAA